MFSSRALSFSMLTLSLMTVGLVSFQKQKTQKPAVPLAAPSITVDVIGTNSITGDVGTSTTASYSLNVSGSPAVGSECTVWDGGSAGPWSGPSYTMGASSNNSGGVTASASPTDGETTTVTFNFLRPGDYTVTVTGSVNFHSSCGDAGKPGTKTVNVHVNGKIWDPGTAISGGEIQNAIPDTGMIEVASGMPVSLAVSAAADTDHWKNGDLEGTEADTVKYTWSSTSDGTLGSCTATTNTWTAPTLADVVSGETCTVTLVISDLPNAIPDDEGGNRHDPSVTRSFTFHVTHKRTWSPDPALPTDDLSLSSPTAKPGIPIIINAPGGKDVDSWTDTLGNSGTDAEDLHYSWSGPGINDTGQRSVVFIPPTTDTAVDVPISCTLDDGHGVGDDGVSGGDDGSRNDAPIVKSITIHVIPNPCGEWKHDSWTEASSVVWTEDGQGYPVPHAPAVTENLKWVDKCAVADTQDPRSESGTYDEVARFTESDGGISYLHVKYQATSKYGGPPTAILEDRRPISRVWSVGTGPGGGVLGSPATGTVMQAGEHLNLAVSVATDNDTWTRGAFSKEESDGVSYSWTCSAGNFTGSTDGTSASWTAPAEADVPAGDEGLTVTFNCVIDDKWKDSETGVTAPDTGTRNDTTGITRSVSVQVLRHPCGRWVHKGWQGGTITWTTDGNGDPKPVAPDNAVETIKWEDLCSATTKPDETRSVPYTLLNDDAEFIDGKWYRVVQYRAYSTCANGESTPAAADEPLTDERALPRHWTVPEKINEGTLKVVNNMPGAKVSPPTTSGQAVAITVPVGTGVSFEVQGAKDQDTYSYWNVPEKVADDEIKYKWTVSGTNSAGTTVNQTVGGVASAGLPALSPGVYTMKCEVDDASSGDETGVVLPDLGNRNDSLVTFTATVKVVPRVWDAGTAVGTVPIFKTDGSRDKYSDGSYKNDETGRLVAPQDQRATKIDSDGKKVPDPDKWKPQVLYARPGQAIDCQVEEAYDFDHWKQDLDDKGASAEETNKPPFQGWDKDEVKYKWTVVPPTSSGLTGTITGDTSTLATWTAPSGKDSAGNPINDSSGNPVNVDGTYTLKCTIDDKWDGEAKGTTPPNEEGSRNDEDGAVVRSVQITIQQTPSHAEFKTYVTGTDPADSDERKAPMPVGGTVWNYLYLTVGQGQSVDPSITSATVRVDETDPIHADQTTPAPYFDTVIDFTVPDAWEYFRDHGDTGALLPAADQHWVTGVNPKTPNNHLWDVQYRRKYSWDTTKLPLGHNGSHMVSIVKVTDNDPATDDDSETQIRFAKDTGALYESGPSALSANVQNLVITDVSTSNGTPDYFKFDGSSSASASLQHPQVILLFKDEGGAPDNFTYAWRVRVRGTDKENWDESVLYSGTGKPTQPITVTINSSPVSSESPKPYVSEWGTYNFDISISKTPVGQTTPTDTISYRSSKLFIPKQMPAPDAYFAGHSAEFRQRPDGDTRIDYEISYYLQDASRTSIPTAEASKLNVDLLPETLGDPIFSSSALERNLNTPFKQKDMKTFEGTDIDLSKVYTSIMSGSDDHGAEYRDHKPKPILAKNRRLIEYGSAWDINLFWDGGTNSVKMLSVNEQAQLISYLQHLFSSPGVQIPVLLQGTTGYPLNPADPSPSINYGGGFTADGLNTAQLDAAGYTPWGTSNTGYHTLIINEIPTVSSKDPGMQVADYKPWFGAVHDWNGPSHRPGLVSLITIGNDKLIQDLADPNREKPPGSGAANFTGDDRTQYIFNAVGHEVFHGIGMKTGHCDRGNPKCITVSPAGNWFLTDMKLLNPVVYHTSTGPVIITQAFDDLNSEVNLLRQKTNRSQFN